MQIHIIDDDDDVRDAIVNVVNGANYQAQPWSSAELFIKANLSDTRPAVIILDLKMNGMSGLALMDCLAKQQKVAKRNIQIILISGYAQAQDVISGFRKGAVEFLLKPFALADLLSALKRSVASLNASEKNNVLMEKSLKQFETLTKQEKVLFWHFSSGKSMVEIANHIPLAMISVKVYKAKIMKKLAFSTLYDLYHFAKIIDPTGKN